MPILTYTLWRLLILLASLGLLSFVMRDWLLAIVAIFATFLISQLTLRGPRDRAAAWLAQRAEQRQAGQVPGAVSDAEAEDSEAGDGPESPNPGESV